MFSRRRSYKHKLVAMGDSMAQGFKNGGIYRTDLSFPALLARSMGSTVQFDQPSFSAQAGIPINIEILIRGLAEKYGDEISLRNSLPAAREMYRTLSRIKSYWDGHLKSLQVDQPTPYHNQAIWGFSISDTMLINDQYSRDYIANMRPRYSVFNVLPDNAMYTTARLVLNPSFSTKTENNTMLNNVDLLQNDGGIENLIVCIGHNNIVGAVTKLRIDFSDENDLNNYYSERKCTVFRPEHFREELRTLYSHVSRMNVKNVFVPTIPYVTIPPATRGVNKNGQSSNGGYFDYYARFWIWDEDFDPEKHPHLTKDNAILLDQIVDQYNEIIRRLAEEFDFSVVPVARYVKAAARRRHPKLHIEPYPPEFIEALKRNNKTNYLVNENGYPRISTDYLRLDDKTGRLDRGGIFSLDGLHPTTIGYGLIANMYRMNMEKRGVRFDHPFDWDYVIENETLVTDPPPLMHDLRKLLRFLAMTGQERLTFFGKNVLETLLETFSSRPELD
ncbi:MAG: hypothetical protein EA391_10735 [Balneolaceae bacterium]|nr:MAG: hypothetical protein EA391_10735 [Balneolaceae bacterium]